MKRLFGFGCSFTNYRWSTWFDCLAPEFEWAENWGQSGAGNMYIFNSIIEADQRYTFGNNDTVIVCWTNVLRDDRYSDKRWITLGGVPNNPIYTKEFIASIDSRGFLIRDIALIQAIKLILEKRPGLTFKFLSMCPLTDDDVWKNYAIDSGDIVKLYQDTFDSILPSYTQLLRPNGWGYPRPNWPFNDDDHPSPTEHLEYLDQVLPGWVTKPETRVKMYQETENIRKDPKRSGMAKVTRL